MGSFPRRGSWGPPGQPRGVRGAGFRAQARGLTALGLPGPSGAGREKAKAKAKLLSRVRLFMTPWPVAYEVPPSMEFSRQEYCQAGGNPRERPGCNGTAGHCPRKPHWGHVSVRTPGAWFSGLRKVLWGHGPFCWPVSSPRPMAEQGSLRTLDLGKLRASRSLVPRSGGQRQAWGPLSRASGALSSHLLNVQVTLDPQTSLLLAFHEDCSEHSGNTSSTPGMLTGSSSNTAISGAAPASPDALLASPACPCSPIAHKPPHGTQAPPTPQLEARQGHCGLQGPHRGPCPSVRLASSTLPCGCLEAFPGPRGWQPPPAQMLRVGDQARPVTGRGQDSACDQHMELRTPAGSPGP